jgi:hypothetical protein
MSSNDLRNWTPIEPFYFSWIDVEEGYLFLLPRAVFLRLLPVTTWQPSLDLLDGLPCFEPPSWLPWGPWLELLAWLFCFGLPGRLTWLELPLFELLVQIKAVQVNLLTALLWAARPTDLTWTAFIWTTLLTALLWMLWRSSKVICL